MKDGERSLAVFIDFENLALGFHNRRDRFDIVRVIVRLVEKGKIVAKKAYADWNRFAQYTASLHEAAIELIEIPRRGQTGKNSADIRLCVDAMDLAYSKEHINTFVVVSGDSDFSPLVSKLKELGKHVIGLGMQESTSDLLRDNCDEFIYYEDLNRPETSPELTPELSSHLPEPKRKAFALLLESLMALRRENKEVIWSSMIKDTMKRKKPSFNEAYHGYRTFSDLLEDAQKEGLLELEIDKRSRTYVVTRFGLETPKTEETPAAVAKKRRRRRSRRRGTGVAGEVVEVLNGADHDDLLNGEEAESTSDELESTGSAPPTPSVPTPQVQPAAKPPAPTRVIPVVELQVPTPAPSHPEDEEEFRFPRPYRAKVQRAAPGDPVPSPTPVTPAPAPKIVERIIPVPAPVPVAPASVAPPPSEAIPVDPAQAESDEATTPVVEVETPKRRQASRRTGTTRARKPATKKVKKDDPASEG